jgi:Sulfatase
MILMAVSVRRGSLTALLHLGALWALAFVQPMFGLLGDRAEFFVARGNTTFDILVFALGYTLVPPLLGAAAVWAAELIGLGRALLLVLIALLVAALVLPPLGDALAGSAASIAVALTVGAGFAVLYARVEWVRTFLTFLSPAPLVFLLFFLVVSPVSDLLRTGEASASVDGPARSSTPIVFILLDELPVSTLMGPGGRIDARRFPNLAELAAGATWYRHATTVAASTSEAVPAQLTGELPAAGDLPTSTHHPRSLFSLFRRSHAFTVVEPITDVCPARLCPEERPPVRARLSALADDLTIVAEHLLLPDDLRDALPAIDRGWLGFRSEGDAPFAGIEARGSRDKLLGKVIERLRADDASIGFAQAIAALDRRSARPPLVFLHSSLPHGPARYLPDGRGYTIHRRSYPGFARERWTRRQWLVDQAFQRHVLQAMYADVLVGHLLAKVKATGIYDDAAILVTADHGVSFRAGEPRRRPTTAAAPEVTLVPFILKAPGQRAGRVDDGAVRTVDALPTLAAAAGVRMPWKADGMPADDRPVDAGAAIEVAIDGLTGTPRSLGTLLDGLREREAVEARLLRHGVYAIGPRPELIGRRAGDDAADGPRATLDAPGDFDDIVPGADVLPALVSGDVRGLAADTVIAIAVNGRVAATTRVFPPGQYVAIVPPESLRAGDNEVAVLDERLRKIGGNRSITQP